MARTCIKSGYMFEFQGKRRWRASSSELWETVVRRNMCGRLVGYRTVDGSRGVVVKVRGKFMAALPHAVAKVR